MKYLIWSFVVLAALPLGASAQEQMGIWTNLWGADRVMRYDPKSGAWTAFDLPTRGAEPRYISLYEPDNGPAQVVLPYFRARKVAITTLRSETELRELSNQAQRQ